MKKHTSRETCADNTKFPKLYGDHYWGSFKYTGEKAQKAVCLNRNNFAEAHGLRRFPWRDRVFWRFKNFWKNSDLDHAELYASGSVGVLLLVSNYGGSPPSCLGMFKASRPLYSFDAQSYFRKWETKESFEKHLGALIYLIDSGEARLLRLNDH